MPTQTADPDRTLEQIEAALATGDQNLATSLAVAAFQGGAEDSVILLLVAENFEKRGFGQRALELLKKAAAQERDDPELWRLLGEMLFRQGMASDAANAFDTALAIDPGMYPALTAAGAASYQTGDLKAAEGYYRRAAGLKPDEPELLATLALIAARRDEPKEARALAERALSLHPDSITAELALARADLLEGLAAVAEARLTKLIRRPDLSSQNRVNALDLRAETLDALDQPAAAFADYQARNAILESIAAPNIKQRMTERRVDQARRLAAYFATASAEPWRERAGEDMEGRRTARHHVFLLGFPRSGTTLLEKVLGSHPDVVTLEEFDHLAAAGGHWLSTDVALNELATLTAAAADASRQIYWRGVRETVGKDISDKVLIDKLPLHTIALPVISKLFPSAKILFALRDPRDVVLSCFRRRFQMNSAMYEFLTLDGAARYYDQVMALATACRSLLHLDIQEVRHEAMVADFEQEVRKVLSFIGADWNSAVTGFAERARRAPRTPSDIQLTRGLNADGVGQWRRYEQQLTPALKIVEPWVNHFNYPTAIAAR
jgi:Flp pilus assembly protein TadD